MNINFIDLDDTLINTSRLKNNFFYEVSIIGGVEFSCLQNVYEGVKKDIASANWEEEFLDKIAQGSKVNPLKIVQIWNKHLQNLQIFTQMREYVEKLEGKKILFTQGNQKLQKKKISLTKLDKLFDEIIIIPSPKIDHIKSLISGTQRSKQFQVLSTFSLVDNSATFLLQVKKEFPRANVLSAGDILAQKNTLYPFFKETFLLMGKSVQKLEEEGFTLDYPFDLLIAAQSLCQTIDQKIEGTIEKGAIIDGKLHLGRGSLIRSGVYLKGDFYIGENTIIGPNCFLKGFGVVGDDCEIGNSVEFARTITGINTNISHLAGVEDTILGDHVRIGGGTIMANRRHSRKNVALKINGSYIDSGSSRLGSFVGDGVKFGINNSVYPGILIGPGIRTLPAEVIDQNRL